jgi:regulator of cell morphogenesis and NO signaling
MAPTIDRTLGELVAERPRRAAVLERRGIDYCCAGRRTLAEACEAAGLDAGEVAAALDAADDDPLDGADRLGPADLVDHILERHHRYLHDELPALEALATKVRDVHAGRHPELERVAALVVALRADLEPHLAREEHTLFPAVRRLLADPAAPPGSGAIVDPIRTMTAQHDTAGELLAALRSASAGYEVPADGCASYHALYARLAAVEADTHRHVHLENNVLFPAVLALAAAASSRRDRRPGPPAPERIS